MALHASVWDFVELDRQSQGGRGATTVASGDPPQASPGTSSLRLERAPDLTVTWQEHEGADRPLDDWQSALAAVCQAMTPGERHLVLAWPDEALWSTTITLAGPVTAQELLAWLPEELDAVLPWGLEGAAWDCFPALPAHRDGFMSGLAWWPRRLSWRRPAEPVGRSSGDVTVRCWAMPVELAQALVGISARLGLACLRVEPSSLARARAARRVGAGTPEAGRLTGVTAYGAACRMHDDGPDLLRHLPLPWVWRVRRWVQSHLPWLLAIAATGSTGLATGAWQAQAWRDAAQQQEGRLRQLQSQLDEHQQGQAQRQRSRQQALELAQQQRARLNHNQQFVQALQGLAASLPPGVHWQSVSLHPHQLALEALASDAQALTRWMTRWPEVVPPGVQPQVHWQPSASRATGSAGPGVVSTTADPVAVDLQLSLSPMTPEKR